MFLLLDFRLKLIGENTQYLFDTLILLISFRKKAEKSTIVATLVTYSFFTYTTTPPPHTDATSLGIELPSRMQKHGHLSSG